MAKFTERDVVDWMVGRLDRARDLLMQGRTRGSDRAILDWYRTVLQHVLNASDPETNPLLKEVKDE